MAPRATIHHIEVDLSDVDRAVYERLELVVARHPSESARYLVLRLLGYCLSYEPGISFSGGGVSSADEPPVFVRDATGALVVWIDVGNPSAARLHKASKAVERVALFTQNDLVALRREAAGGGVHRADAIDVWTFEEEWLTALEPLLARRTQLDLVRTEEQLYVTVGGLHLNSTLAHSMLADPAPSAR